MFETFDHTADLGLRIRATSLESLFIEAAAGLQSLQIENQEAVREIEEYVIELDATELQYLFFDWLREILMQFEVSSWVFRSIRLRLHPLSLHATFSGEIFDPDRHGRNHEVKAITYHDYRLENLGDAGWLAEVIVDI
jgi:SHS2 domain-containing protein